MTSVVHLARNPLEALPVNLERREVVFLLDRYDVDVLYSSALTALFIYDRD
jgi:hypothetical protein